MEDYEDEQEQAPPEPSPALGADALESVVRPALVAATRLFLVAGVALVLVDETGELRGAVAAGDLAEALEEAAPSSGLACPSRSWPAASRSALPTWRVTAAGSPSLGSLAGRR